MKHIGYLPSHGRPLPTYTGPPWKQSEPEVPVTPEQIAAWRVKWGATCSDKVARLLTALERDYAITGAAPGRSAGPTA